MSSILLISLIALWCLVLVNMLLVLRVVHLLRKLTSKQELAAEQERLPELSVGERAPDFSAKELSGKLVSLASYTGHPVAFFFVSPHCGRCRREIPTLMKLSITAKARAGVEFFLVSDASTAETHDWITTLREEDGVEVNLPVLIAPRTNSDFLKTYDPRGLTPYYCFLDEQGIVQARGPLGMGEWPRLEKEWGGSPLSSPRAYTRKNF